ncbi:MAG: phospholipase D family protein [Planctomycetes bacterium]|nr:phospholipase D family protein [Planctomycetota bacterium]
MKLATSASSIRISSAYVTDTALLKCAKSKRIDCRLLTRLSARDVASGATSLRALKNLLEEGIDVRIVPSIPTLHAKVYIFGNDTAVVSSANLTNNGLDSNIEVGVKCSGSEVTSLIAWFDALWDLESTRQLSQSWLDDIEGAAAELREVVDELEELDDSITVQMGKLANLEVPEPHKDAQYFFCNTNRKYSHRLASGLYEDEQRMYQTGFAAAWTPFNWPTQMKEVTTNDIILMYAKKVGVVGAGVVTGGLEIEPRPAVVSRRAELGNEEWRFPVKWLVWVSDRNAYHYQNWLAPNATFGRMEEKQGRRALQHLLSVGSGE